MVKITAQQNSIIKVSHKKNRCQVSLCLRHEIINLQLAT